MKVELQDKEASPGYVELQGVEASEAADIGSIASPFGDLKEQEISLPALASIPSIFTNKQERQAGNQTMSGVPDKATDGLQIATSPRPSAWLPKDTPMSPVSPTMPTVFRQR